MPSPTSKSTVEVEFAAALLYHIEQLPSDQVDRTRARVRECAG